MATTFCKRLYLRFVSVIFHKRWLIGSIIPYLSVALCSVFVANAYAWREGDIGTSVEVALCPRPIKCCLPYVMHVRKGPRLSAAFCGKPGDEARTYVCAGLSLKSQLFHTLPLFCTPVITCNTCHSPLSTFSPLLSFLYRLACVFVH